MKSPVVLSIARGGGRGRGEDSAAGECFDTAARGFGLRTPGPFSGLKTAAARWAERHRLRGEELPRAAKREGEQWMDWYVGKLARYEVSPPVTDVASAVRYLLRERSVTLGAVRREGWGSP